MVTKGPIAREMLEDPWFIALSILAVAAITCVAACRNNPGVVLIPFASDN
jgi:hypothetical protein